MDWTGMTFRTAAKEKRAESRSRIERAKIGDTVLWCETCAGFVKVDEQGYDGKCPQCGSPIFRMKCTRCSNQWYPRDPLRLPGTCPHCKSPYYNKTRVRAENAPRAEKPKVVVPADGLAKVIERMEAEE